MKPERQAQLSPASDSRHFDARYFEDYVPGAVHVAGALEVTESEVVEFARRYDPQPMHTDPRPPRAAGSAALLQAAGIPAR